MQRRTFLATLFGGFAAAGLGSHAALAAPVAEPLPTVPADADALAAAVDATDAEFSQYYYDGPRRRRRYYRRRPYYGRRYRRGPYYRGRRIDRRARPRSQR